jgi:carbon storage regulator
MLVLSRKIGEQIIIGDAIRVNVVGVHGNCVRLGIAAPPQISVWREELVAEDPGVVDRQPRPRKPANLLAHE